MNTVQTINTTKMNFGALGAQSQRGIESADKATSVNARPSKVLDAVSYTNESTTAAAVRTAEVDMRNVNNMTSLIQSVDGSASAIENKLYEMKAIALSETQCACQRIGKAQESIKDAANNFSWNGKNFMVGGGQNDQTTTLLSYNLNIGTNPKDSLRIDFKSFNPMSAVDTDGEIGPVEPNLPDLNQFEGTDTHAYGNAALYSNSEEKNYLHIHSEASRANAIIQINRAIDGVTAERLRLSKYLTRLNLIAERTQDEGFDSNSNVSQIKSSNHAHQVTERSKADITQKPSVAILAQANYEGSQLLELLH